MEVRVGVEGRCIQMRYYTKKVNRDGRTERIVRLMTKEGKSITT